MYPYLGAWVGGIVSWVFSLFPSAIPFGMALYWRNKSAEKERYGCPPLGSVKHPLSPPPSAELPGKLLRLVALWSMTNLTKRVKWLACVTPNATQAMELLRVDTMATVAAEEAMPRVGMNTAVMVKVVAVVVMTPMGDTPVAVARVMMPMVGMAEVQLPDTSLL